MAIWDYEDENEYNLVGNMLKSVQTSGLGQAVGAGFSALGTGVNTGMDILNRPSQGMRNVAFGGYEDPFDRGDILGGLGARRDAFMEGMVNNAGPRSTSEALYNSGIQLNLPFPDINMGPIQRSGPLDVTGLAGFGADVLVDPLNILPTGPIGKMGKFAGADDALRATSTANALGDAVPWGRRVGDEINRGFAPAEGAAHLVREGLKAMPPNNPLSKGARTFLDPRLDPESPIKIGWTGFQAALEDIPNQATNITARFGGDMGLVGAELRREYDAVANNLLQVATTAGRQMKREATKLEFDNPEHTRDILERIHMGDFARTLVERGHVTQMDVLGLENAQKTLDDIRSTIRTADDLHNLTSRMVRGEKVTTQFVDPFRNDFPSVAKDLDNYINQVATRQPNYRGRAANRQAEITAIRDRVKAQVDILHAMDRSAEAYALAFESAQKGRVAHLETLEKTQPYLKGMWFSPAEAEAFQTLTADRPNTFIRGVSELSNLSRGLQATADMSGPFIQGTLLLMTHPLAFLEGWTRGAETLFRSGGLRRYLSQPDVQEVLARAPGLGTAAGSADFFDSGIMKKIGDKVPLAGNLYGRFEESFNTFGSVARVEWAKALLPQYEAAGKVNDLVDIVNHATGVTMVRGMGMSSTQSTIESAFMFFAPRYVRSALALVGDMIHNPTGPATEAVASLLTAGVANYVHLSANMGQKPQLDPSDSRFMTVEIGDSRVGIGGVWTALARTMAASISDPGSLGAPFTTTSPDKWTPVEAMSNPLFRFWRGRASPFTSQFLDVAAQESYIGTPLKTIPDMLKHGVGMFLPLGFQGILTEWGAPGTAGGVNPVQFAAGELGLRSFPRRTSDLLEEAAKDTYGTTWEGLDPVQQAQLRNTDKLKSLPAPQGAKFEGQRERTKLMNEYSRDLETAANLVAKGEMTKVGFKEAERRLSDRRDSQMDRVESNIRPSDQPKEIARQEYLAKFQADSITGRVDYEAAESYYATLDPETQRYIDQKRQASLEYLGPEAKKLMTELQTARETLRPYWEVQNKVLEKYRPELAAEIRALAPNDPRMKEIEQSQVYKLAAREWTRQREFMRMRDRDLDNLLVEWYGRTPIFARRRR